MERRKISCLGGKGQKDSPGSGEQGGGQGVDCAAGGGWSWALMLLAHTPDTPPASGRWGWSREEQKGKELETQWVALVPSPLLLKEEPYMSLPLDSGGTWKLGTAGKFLGPSVTPHLSSLPVAIS